ncbi:4366_t:CDS:2 [Cetraspora pellucida]|uniref:4366_t:CDS:1 n=1 Tax=Cetraspora pellucida TaxID=1433469 RepID=A0ACA9K7U9_9GLOM|nr:4366_t:CDS:2 [Cetraspora pellucida]
MKCFLELYDFSEEYPPKDGFENNRQLNVIARAILIDKELVNEIGLKLTYSHIYDVFELFEYRLYDIGKTLFDSFSYLMADTYEHFSIEAIKPERNLTRKNVFYFLYYPLSLTPNYYNWVLLKFKASSPIVSFYFEDILQTRVSIDVERQDSSGKLNGATQTEVETACNIYNIYYNAGNFFLPTYMNLISQASEYNILGPLFEVYLPELYNYPITFPFPLPEIKGNLLIPLSSVNDHSNRKSSITLIQELSVVLDEMNHSIISNEMKVTEEFKKYFTAFLNLFNS